MHPIRNTSLFLRHHAGTLGCFGVVFGGKFFLTMLKPKVNSKKMREPKYLVGGGCAINGLPRLLPYILPLRLCSNTKAAEGWIIENLMNRNGVCKAVPSFARVW